MNVFMFYECFLVLALLFIFIIFFFSLRVCDPKLMHPKINDRPELWPLLPPDCYINILGIIYLCIIYSAYAAGKWRTIFFTKYISIAIIT